MKQSESPKHLPREDRVAEALRENLRKRKVQHQIRLEKKAEKKE